MNLDSSESPIIAELWYDEDYLVIFQAGSFLCKLPHSPLSKKSTVFREFFASPNHISKEFERGLHVSGLPLINFLGVSSEEGEMFLSALYNAEYFERPPAQTSLSIVLAVLKLSTKYAVQFLRLRALAHLSLAYPTSLEHWDLREERSTFPLTRDYSSFGCTTVTDTLTVIETAEIAEAPWILPSAFYECCQYDLYSILNHPMWTDRRIDHELQTTILVGFSNQIQTTPKALTFLLLKPLDGCLNSSFCSETRRAALEESLTWSMQKPLEVWNNDDWDDAKYQMCYPCQSVCQKTYRDTRNRIWEGLPDAFNLPTWEQLIDLEEAAMRR